MNLDPILLSITIASLACCIWTHFIRDSEDSFMVDPLTKVYNRHFLPIIEENELAKNKYYVVFTDIDHFKKINDTYGHEAGDIALKEFARILKLSIKNNIDYVVRWGGEEFVLFLKVNDTSIFTKEKLKERMETLRELIERTKIEVVSKKGEKIDLNITASFGLCANIAVPIESRIKNADKKLYKAKESGRNKVVV